MSQNTIKFTGQFKQKLKRFLDRYKYTVEVGFAPDRTPDPSRITSVEPTNVQLAMFHEYGTVDMPARPFFTVGKQLFLKRMEKGLAKFKAKVILGKGYLPEALGQEYVDSIREAIVRADTFFAARRHSPTKYRNVMTGRFTSRPRRNDLSGDSLGNATAMQAYTGKSADDRDNPLLLATQQLHDSVGYRVIKK